MLNKINRFAFIIGSMKSGTTSLFDLLSQHPEICPCLEKEPNFFSIDEVGAKGLDWYLGNELWDWSSPQHSVAMEASTSYTKLPHFGNAAERISQQSGTFKFIYIMRDPIERIRSQYRFGLTRPWGRGKKVSEMLGHAIDVSRYASQLDEYRSRFGRDSLLLLSFDDLKNDPENLLVRVCRFLDIDASFQFDCRREAQNKTEDRRIDNALLNFVKRFVLLRKFLIKVVPMRIRKIFTSRMQRAVDEKFELSVEDIARIRNELQDEMTRLEREYGFDTTHWKTIHNLLSQN